MRVLLFATTLLVFVPLTATASHTPAGRCPEGGMLDLIEIAAGGGTAFYVDSRSGSPYLYAESNGMYTDRGPGVFLNDETTRHNLQRGGASPFIPDDAEICVDNGDFGPDMMVL